MCVFDFEKPYTILYCYTWRLFKLGRCFKQGLTLFNYYKGLTYGYYANVLWKKQKQRTARVCLFKQRLCHWRFLSALRHSVDLFLFKQRCRVLVVIPTFAQNVGTSFLSREFRTQCAALAAPSASLWQVPVTFCTLLPNFKCATNVHCDWRIDCFTWVKIKETGNFDHSLTMHMIITAKSYTILLV